MQHIAVESNLLASVAYDGASIMQVLYRRGGLYNHENVTIEEFEQLLNPGPEFEHSVGKAYNAIIKGRKPTFKVEAGNAQTEHTPTPPTIEAAAGCSICGNLTGHTIQCPRLTSETAGIPAEAQAVSRKSTELATQAAAIEITNPAAQEEASQVLLTIAAMRKEIADTFKPMKDAAFKAHRVICDQEKTIDAPLAAAERLIKDRIGAYVQEQRRLAAIVDEQNRQAERARAEEEARQRAAEQAIEQAVELEARGDVKAAEAVLSNPAPVPVRYMAPAPVAPAVAQVKGVATRFEWAGRVIDPSKVPDEYKTINESLINAVIKRSAGKIRIPGVENYEKPVVASSRRG